MLLCWTARFLRPVQSPYAFVGFYIFLSSRRPDAQAAASSHPHARICADCGGFSAGFARQYAGPDQCDD
jgi:hypothetical protein